MDDVVIVQVGDGRESGTDEVGGVGLVVGALAADAVEELAAQREEMNRVVDDLIATDDSEMMVMSMLRGDDLRGALVDESALATPDPDLLAGPFAHVIVDEAQELSAMAWRHWTRSEGNMRSRPAKATMTE